MINCKKHQLQNTVLTSPYMHHCIVNDQSPSKKIISVKLFIEVLNEWFYFLSDDDFLIKNNIIQNEPVDSIEISNLGEKESFEISAKTLPVCEKCYFEFLEKFDLKDAFDLLK